METHEANKIVQTLREEFRKDRQNREFRFDRFGEILENTLTDDRTLEVRAVAETSIPPEFHESVERMEGTVREAMADRGPAEDFGLDSFYANMESSLRDTADGLEDRGESYLGRFARALTDIIGRVHLGVSSVFGKLEERADDLEDEEDRLEGRRFGVFSRFWSGVSKLWSEQVVDRFKSGFESAVDFFKNAWGEILGPVADLFSAGWNMVSGVFGSLKEAFFGGDDEELDEAKRQSGYLEWIRDYFVRQEKKEAFDFDDKPKHGLMKYIIPTVIALGALVGAFAGRIALFFRMVLAPFEMGMRVLNRLTGVFRAFTPVIATFSKAVKTAGDFFRSIGAQISRLPLIGRMFDIAVRIFGTFARSIVWGFTRLVWPLTIIMAAVDFFIGFFKSEGTFLERIKAGLMNAVKGFVELPSKLLGMAADWVLGLFGVKIEGGSGKKIFDFIMNTAEKLIDLIMMPFSIIANSMRMMWDVFTAAGGQDRVIKILDDILDFFQNLGSLVGNYIKKTLEGIPGAKRLMDFLGFGGRDEAADVIPKASASRVTQVDEMEEQRTKLSWLRRKKEDENHRELVRSQEGMTKELTRINETNTKNVQAINTAVNNVLLTRREEKRDIPDQTEALGILVYNNSF
jgi:hypothetical protein